MDNEEKEIVSEEKNETINEIVEENMKTLKDNNVISNETSVEDNIIPIKPKKNKSLIILLIIIIIILIGICGYFVYDKYIKDDNKDNSNTNEPKVVEPTTVPKVTQTIIDNNEIQDTESKKLYLYTIDKVTGYYIYDNEQSGNNNLIKTYLCENKDCYGFVDYNNENLIINDGNNSFIYNITLNKLEAMTDVKVQLKNNKLYINENMVDLYKYRYGKFINNYQDEQTFYDEMSYRIKIINDIIFVDIYDYISQYSSNNYFLINKNGNIIMDYDLSNYDYAEIINNEIYLTKYYSGPSDNFYCDKLVNKKLDEIFLTVDKITYLGNNEFNYSESINQKSYNSLYGFDCSLEWYGKNFISKELVSSLDSDAKFVNNSYEYIISKTDNGLSLVDYEGNIVKNFEILDTHHIDAYNAYYLNSDNVDREGLYISIIDYHPNSQNSYVLYYNDVTNVQTGLMTMEEAKEKGYDIFREE